MTYKSRMIKFRLILTGVIAVVYCLTLAMQAHAQSIDRAVVQDKRGQPVLEESNGTCVRTKWSEDHDPCHGSKVETVIEQQVKKPMPIIAQDERTVYFPFNVAALPPEQMSRLDTLANDIKSRNDIKGARVVGFADHIGTPGYNEALSKKRAENVKNYLVSKGIVNASVAETRWFGDSMPATNCPNDLPRADLIGCLQKDRRVEVEIDYIAQVVAAK